MLKITDIIFGYDQPLCLKPFSINLNHGQIISILGLNGIGKTTFLKTLAGLVKPLHGSVKIFEHNIHQLQVKSRAKFVTMVFSTLPTLRQLSVSEIIETGFFSKNTKTSKNTLHSILKTTGLSELKDQDYAVLSDGQKQKVLIARALAQDTPVILLDEPVSYLDFANRHAILSLLSDIAKKQNKIIIFSTHDLDIALQYSDTTLVLTKEKILYGLPEDLILNGKIKQAFSNSGLSFDNLTGKLYVDKKKNGKKIAFKTICNNPFYKHWTEHFLHRFGFSIDDSSEFKLNLTKEEKQCVWKLEHYGQIYVFYQLQQLAKFLNKNIEL